LDTGEKRVIVDGVVDVLVSGDLPDDLRSPI
jgi:hypothetical protein